MSAYYARMEESQSLIAQAELCECHVSRQVMFYRHELSELTQLVENCRHAAAVAREE